MEVHASGSPQEDRHFLKNNHSESILTFAHSCSFVSDVAHLTSGPNFCYPRETPNPMGSTVFPESGRNQAITLIDSARGEISTPFVTIVTVQGLKTRFIIALVTVHSKVAASLILATVNLCLCLSGFVFAIVRTRPTSRGVSLVVKLASWPTPQIPKALRKL